MNDDSAKAVAVLSAKFDAFVTLYNVEYEHARQQMKDFKEYLQKDVKTALNGQKEVRDQINDLYDQIGHMQVLEAGCPIRELADDVKMLKDETRVSRAIHKYPELEKSVGIYKTIVIIMGSLGGILVILEALKAIFHWKTIFGGSL